MEVSRLTFTKETKEKMERPLNHFQRGELRWKRIKEYEDNGTLSKARNRMDLVEMLGAERKYNAVYSWISNMVTRGFIKETMTGVDANGKMEYEYHTVRTPNFSPASNAHKGCKVTEKPTPKAVAIPVIDKEPKQAKVVIKYNDLTIELENIDRETIEGIVEKLALVTKQ